jgi:hypothetical protein
MGKREDIKERKAAVITPTQSKLEAEAEKIRAAISSGTLEDDGPEPGDEAEAEFRQTTIVTPAGAPAARKTAEDMEREAIAMAKAAQEARRAEAAARAPQEPGLIGVTWGSYVSFCKRGVEPSTAKYLVIAHALLEVGDAIHRAIRSHGSKPS